METLKTLAADVSFGGNIPTLEFQTDVFDAAQFVQSMESQYPNANFTLTGHSLGGAIAQVIGLATGLPTIVFNAPGAGALYGQLGTQISGLAPNNHSTYTDAHYRLNGDQVSLLGTPIAGETIFTLAAPSYLTIPVNSFFDAAAADVMAYTSDILELHFINTVILQVAGNAQETPGAIGANYAAVIENFTQPSVVSILPAAIYQFLFLVSDANGLLLDPIAGTDFVFTNQSGSPDFASLALPALSGVSFYDVRDETNGVWSEFFPLQPGALTTFDSDVSGLEFIAVDSGGNAISLTNFLFNVSFSSTGTFTGTLVASSTIPPLLPILQIALNGNQVSLSWSTNVVAGLSLFATASLNLPISWTAITNIPIVVGNQNVVTLPISNGGSFFRLQN
jgi:hypothetical protein